MSWHGYRWLFDTICIHEPLFLFIQFDIHVRIKTCDISTWERVTKCLGIFLFTCWTNRFWNQCFSCFMTVKSKDLSSYIFFSGTCTKLLKQPGGCFESMYEYKDMAIFVYICKLLLFDRYLKLKLYFYESISLYNFVYTFRSIFVRRLYF